MYLSHAPDPNGFKNVRMSHSSALLARTARTSAVDQAMPIGIGAVGEQTSANGAVRIEEGGIRTLHQMPRQGSCTARRIEPTLRLHDDAPAQALAGSGVESRHGPFRLTRRAPQPSAEAGPTAGKRVVERV